MTQIARLRTDPLISKCEDVAALLKELAHRQRLQMLCHLAGEEKRVGDLTALCGASQSRVSQFLAQMRRDRLVSARRDGKFVYYRISDPRVERLMRSLRKIFCS